MADAHERVILLDGRDTADPPASHRRGIEALVDVVKYVGKRNSDYQYAYDLHKK